MTPKHRTKQVHRRSRGLLGVAATVALLATSLGGVAIAATDGDALSDPVGDQLVTRAASPAGEDAAGHEPGEGAAVLDTQMSGDSVEPGDEASGTSDPADEGGEGMLLDQGPMSGSDMRDSEGVTVAPLLAPSTCTGNNCRTLSLELKINGGTATANDFVFQAIRATTGANAFVYAPYEPETYIFPSSGRTAKEVPMGSDYLIVATPKNPNDPNVSKYQSRLTCTVAGDSTNNGQYLGVWMGRNTGTGGLFPPARAAASCTLTLNQVTGSKMLHVTGQVLPGASSGTAGVQRGANAADVQGITYRLYEGWTFGTVADNRDGLRSRTPLAPTAWSCTVTSGASCDISIPVPAPRNDNVYLRRAYYVVAESPDRWSGVDVTSYNPGDIVPLNDKTFGVPFMALGYPPDQEAYSMPYLGRTPEISATTDTLAVTNFPSQNQTTGTLGHRWEAAASLNNPQLPETCEPLKIAVQIDMSSSVTGYYNGTTQWDRINEYRNALKGLADQLVGTGSSLALFTFGTNSPIDTGREFPDLMTVDSGNLQTIKTRIDDLTAPGTWGAPGTPEQNQFTNWDGAFRRVAQQNAANAARDYDVLLFITDGIPNTIGNTPGSPSGVLDQWTTLAPPNGAGRNHANYRAIEEGILSANAVKDLGMRVVGVGINMGGTGDVGTNNRNVWYNLAAVSGPNANDDFYIRGWDELNSTLAGIANEAACQASVEINKQTREETAAGVWSNWAPRDGWPVSAGVTNTSPAGTTMTPNAGSAQETGAGTGQANWTFKFSKRNGAADVAASETVAHLPGYAWESTQYTVHHADGTSTGPLPLTGPSDNGTQNVKAGERISYTFRNQLPLNAPIDGQFKITKKFDSTVPSGSGNVAFSGSYVCTLDGSEVAKGTWTREGDGPATLTPTVPSDGTPGETVPVAPGASCTATETGIGTGGLTNNSQGLPSGSIWGQHTTDSPQTVVANETAEVTVTNRASTPPEKTINETPEQTGYVVGDTVQYTISQTVPSTKNPDGVFTEASFYDNLGESLGYGSTVSVKVNGVDAEYDLVQNGSVVEWKLKGASLANLKAGDTFEVVFNATVLKVTETGEIANPGSDITEPGYGSSFDDEKTPGEPTPYTYWGQLVVKKVDEDQKPLAGAEFEVTEKGAEDCAVELGSQAVYSTGTSGADGVVLWTPNNSSPLGLFVANSNDGPLDAPTKDYCVYETKVPAGYTGAGVQKVTIKSGATNALEIDIENTQKGGPTLPLTGGQAAAMYTILGLLVLGGTGAAGLAWYKRRSPQRG